MSAADKIVEAPMSNLEHAAADYARRKEAAYVAKRGGAAPPNAALNVYLWAFERFMANPEVAA